MFSSQFQIYYEDTDLAGVVYHANYLKYMERGRTDYLSHLGFDLHDLFLKQGIQFVICDIHAKFIKPASLGDKITILTRVTKIGAAKMFFEQAVAKKQENQLVTLCEGKVVVACLDKTFKPIRIPEALREELKRDIRDIHR